MGICASKSDQQTSANVKVATTTRTRPVARASSKPANKSSARPDQTKETSRGQKIIDDVDENKIKLSPQEAARLAAEKRLQDNNAKSTRGALGKKLAEEKSKSHKSHLMEQAERRQLEKAANNNLVYD